MWFGRTMLPGELRARFGVGSPALPQATHADVAPFFAQTCAPWQDVPQAPQLFLLLCRLTHVPLHRVGCVDGQTHLPLEQTWPPVHTTPH